jgi:hypothetical protein
VSQDEAIKVLLEPIAKAISKASTDAAINGRKALKLQTMFYEVLDKARKGELTSKEADLYEWQARIYTVDDVEAGRGRHGGRC